MKLILISDTHESHHKLTIPKCDILIHAGDFTYNGSASAIHDFNEWLGEQPAEFKVVIAGNHDLTCDPDHSSYSAAEKLLTNCSYLNDSGKTLYGLNIWGSPMSPTFGFGWAFNRNRGEEIQEHWDLIPEGTDILITHGPAYGILDRPFGKQSPVGCSNLATTVGLKKPKLHVAGHIHGDYGLKRFDTTLHVNASSVNEVYQITNSPVVVCTVCWNQSDECPECKDWIPNAF